MRLKELIAVRVPDIPFRRLDSRMDTVTDRLAMALSTKRVVIRNLNQKRKSESGCRLSYYSVRAVREENPDSISS